MGADTFLRKAPRFIDAHAHVWSCDDGARFPMRDKIAALQRDFPLSELARLQDASGVAATVLIQAVDEIGESLRLLDLAQDNSRIAGVVCWADLREPQLSRLLAQYRTYPKFVGIRPMPADTFGADWIGTTIAQRAFDVLRTTDCAVDLLVPMHELAHLHAALVPHPGLRCVLDHGGRPNVMAGISANWRDDMRRLARDTGVVVKCSGLAERAGVEWTTETLKPFIGHLLDTFGPRRVMFASNWPIVTLACGYALWVETVLCVLVDFGLDASEVDMVMRSVARDFYRLGDAPAIAAFPEKETPWH